MKPVKTVLLVEDNPGDARLLREMFHEHIGHAHELTHVMCMRDAEEHLSKQSFDFILLDLGLPDADGIEAIRRARIAAPRTPMVVLTGLDDESVAALALQKGAQDYLIKGQIETRGLLRAMRYATERKRLEQMKDEFVSTVSHELRTPLTSISASIGLLMVSVAGALPDGAFRLLTIANTNCQRLVRMVGDILDLEKMEAGQTVFNFERVEVRSEIEKVIDANRGFAEGHSVRIRLEGDATVCYAQADPDRLAQVVTNLLSNAIKYSAVDGEVVVAIEDGPNVIRISVRDHGSGIPIEFKPRIFERFAQANGTDARLKGGAGLGLSIVKQIVDRLGGSVKFVDAPGGGTIFCLELPCWAEVASRETSRDVHSGNSRMSS